MTNTKKIMKSSEIISEIEELVKSQSSGNYSKILKTKLPK